MSLERQFTRITGIHDLKEQISAFQILIDEIVASGSISNLQSTFTRLLADDVSQQVTRSAVVHFAKSIKSLSGEPFEEVAGLAINSIKQNVVSYDEADFILREALFEYYCGCEQFKLAAQNLAGVNIESTTRIFTETEKVDIHVKCAEAFLVDDEPVDAEIFVSKASAHINSIQDPALQLRYRLTYARILDANRKFVEAATRYYELSNTSTVEVTKAALKLHINVNQGDLLELLGKAVTCAVLGKSGPQRSRVLGLLYKDERLRNLEQLPSYSSHPSILAKIYTQQLLLRDELAVFESNLMPHQKALSSDGFTIPEKAVIEHNMLATSKIYDNITIVELGNILRLSAQMAEKVAARMITEDRLKGVIDQTEGILEFEDEGDPLLQWDDSIRVLCDEMTECVDSIQQKYALVLDA